MADICFHPGFFHVENLKLTWLAARTFSAADGCAWVRLCLSVRTLFVQGLVHSRVALALLFIP